MTQNTIRYREATLADAAEIARLCANAPQEEGYWKARIYGYMNFELNPHQATDKRLVYVAVHKDIIVGFIAGHLTKRAEYTGQIQWIMTAEQCRRTGVASELIWIMAGWFIEHHVTSVRTDVDPENTGTWLFYQYHHALSINRYWLFWDDIRLVLNDPEPGKFHNSTKIDF